MSFLRDLRVPRPRRTPNAPVPSEQYVPSTEPDRNRPGGSIVDNGIYVDGRRVKEPSSLDETYAMLDGTEGGMAWIGFYRPSAAEIGSVAQEFDLHHLAVEDAIAAHQRPKLERYGSTLFCVLRPAQYIDAEERVEFGELHLFVGDDFVVTVRHAESPDLGRVRRRLEASPELLRLGPEAVLYAVLDEVVDEYGPVVSGLQNDIDEIEDQLFSGDAAVTRRIYELSREVMEFQRTTRPLLAILRGLEAGFDKYRVDEELQRSLRDVADHVIRTVEAADSFRSVLQSAMSVHATLVGQRQNEEMRTMTEASLAQNEQMKRISSWAAILFAPSLIGAVYGMNFDVMPETHWQWGYPFALVLMLAIAVLLYVVFRARRWL
ncbi:magnesium and cobalt transport protein CorA [Microlunatus soli]|uniref:Magnesium transporter n=1 Tax=Microlunatus soli TaxID=630515 RepID=A0A1H1TK36_9ACTN|nr:magnesium and cobalt transport protein CorA [Microlunatus soli]SDS60336.1 magnesium transporter [Microlunatus soli]